MTPVDVDAVQMAPRPGIVFGEGASDGRNISYPSQGFFELPPDNAYLKASASVILSIWPVQMTRVLPYCGSLTFILPASKKDIVFHRTCAAEVMAKPVKALLPPGAKPQEFYQDQLEKVTLGQGYVAMKVYDTFQWTRDITEKDKEAFIPKPISARQVAEAMVKEWTEGLGLAGGRAGIEVRNPLETEQAQLARMRKTQEDYFRARVREADVRFGRQELKEINDLDRTALEWLGVERPWHSLLEETLLKVCPACADRIKAQALRCKHCQLDLPEWFYKHYRQVPDYIAAVDPAVYKFLQQTEKIKVAPPSVPPKTDLASPGDSLLKD